VCTNNNVMKCCASCLFIGIMNTDDPYSPLYCMRKEKPVSLSESCELWKYDGAFGEKQFIVCNFSDEN